MEEKRSKVHKAKADHEMAVKDSDDLLRTEASDAAKQDAEYKVMSSKNLWEEEKKELLALQAQDEHDAQEQERLRPADPLPIKKREWQGK